MSELPRTWRDGKGYLVVPDAVHEVTLQGDIWVAFDHTLKGLITVLFTRQSSWPKHQRPFWKIHLRTGHSDSHCESLVQSCCPITNAQSFHWLIPHPISFFSHDTPGTLWNCLFIVAFISSNNGPMPLLLLHSHGCRNWLFPQCPASGPEQRSQAPSQDTSSLKLCPLELRTMPSERLHHMALIRPHFQRYKCTNEHKIQPCFPPRLLQIRNNLTKGWATLQPALVPLDHVISKQSWQNHNPCSIPQTGTLPGCINLTGTSPVMQMDKWVEYKWQKIIFMRLLRLKANNSKLECLKKERF